MIQQIVSLVTGNKLNFHPSPFLGSKAKSYSLLNISSLYLKDTQESSVTKQLLKKKKNPTYILLWRFQRILGVVCQETGGRPNIHSTASRPHKSILHTAVWSPFWHRIMSFPAQHTSLLPRALRMKSSSYQDLQGPSMILLSPSFSILPPSPLSTGYVSSLKMSDVFPCCLA